MRKILLLNLGTTSFKCKLYAEEEGKLTELASAETECVGAQESMEHLTVGDIKEDGVFHCPNHQLAFDRCAEKLIGYGLFSSLAEIDAVCYKAVHGGAVSGTQPVTEELLAAMEKVVPLAPAHNPIYMNLMRSMRAKYPQLFQLARFETSFHSDIPLYRAIYGAPYEWYEKYGVRRYGFHGSSHEYISDRLKELDPTAKRVISLHLGGSSSACAILEGKSIATSMGATLQSGLYQNNRVGDFDAFSITTVLEKYGSLEKALKALSSEGGLLGVSGVSNDLRKIEEAAKAGNERAKLAIDGFVDGIVGYVGMYTAYLGGADAIVFTGGIGTNSALIRRLVCDKLAFLSAKLDGSAEKGSGDRLVSSPESGVRIWAIRTNEEYILAKKTLEYLSCAKPEK